MSGKKFQNYNPDNDTCNIYRTAGLAFDQQKLAVSQTTVLQLKKDFAKTALQTPQERSKIIHMP